MKIVGSKKQVQWIRRTLGELRKARTRLEAAEVAASEEGRVEEASRLRRTIESIRAVLDAFDAAENDRLPSGHAARRIWLRLTAPAPGLEPTTLDDAKRVGILAAPAFAVLGRILREIEGVHDDSVRTKPSSVCSPSHRKRSRRGPHLLTMDIPPEGERWGKRSCIIGSRRQTKLVRELLVDLAKLLHRLEKEHRRLSSRDSRDDAERVHATIEEVRSVLGAFDAAARDTVSDDPDAARIQAETAYGEVPGDIRASAAIDRLVATKRRALEQIRSLRASEPEYQGATL